MTDALNPRRATHANDVARAEILRCAAGLMRAKGFHGMSMRDLAQACHRPVAALYYYFDSKDAVLKELQIGAFENLIISAHAFVERFSSSSDRLYAFILHHVTSFIEQPDVMRVLIYEASVLDEEARRQVEHLKGSYFFFGRSLLQHVADDAGTRISETELDRRSYCLFGMLNWTYAWYKRDQHGVASSVAHSIFTAAQHGLAAAEGVARAHAAADALITHHLASLIRERPGSHDGVG